MLGPLPQVYRIIVSAVALAVFVSSGAWTAFMLPFPILVSVGAGSGLAIGGLCAYSLLHEFHHVPSQQTSRARRAPTW